MFQTNAFFRFYYCPKLRKKEKCSRPYCQYNHGEQTDQCIIDYSQKNFGYDDFFTNLKPEDIDSYKPTHYSTAVQKTPTSILTSNDSSLVNTSSSSKIVKKTKDDLLNVDQSSTNKDKHNKTDQSIDFPTAEQGLHLPKAVQSGSGTQTRLGLGTKRKYDDLEVEGLDIHNKKTRIAHNLNHAITNLNNKATKKKINYQQKLLERYSQTYSPIRDAKSLNSIIDNKMKSSIDIETEKKLPVVSNESLFLPIPAQTSKISLKTRSKVLGRIHAELIKLKGGKDYLDLAREAQTIEHEFCASCKGLEALYVSMATSKICSLRIADESDNKKVTSLKKFDYTKDYSIMGKSSKKNFKDLTIDQLVPILAELTVPKESLKKLGYSFLDPKTDLAVFPMEKNDLCDLNVTTHVECDRCLKLYKLPQVPEDGTCHYHEGHAYHQRFPSGMVGRRYSCCGMKPYTLGCETKSCHVTKGYQFREYRMGFVRTESSASPPNVYALDCEMCYTELGFEMCRVTVLDFEGAVIYDQLVKPKSKIIDYNTKYSGLNEKDFLGVTAKLEDVQEYLLKMISAETFVIGHSLDSDLRVLKIIHERVIDTAYLYPHKQGLPFKRALKNLAKDHLNKIIQNDEAGHDSSEDARAALELVHLKIQDEVNKLVL